MENYSILIPSYTVGPEAYNKIPEYCRPYGKKAVVIGGTKAMAAAKGDLLKGVEGSEITITDFVLYGTECTYENAEALEKLPAVFEADMIFAVGGGKAVDTAKLVAIALKKPYFSFPTLASNCAAASSLAIAYNPDGSFRAFVHFLESAKHVFINTRIIAEAPFEYLWAGIGDTYAKYYEVSVSAKGELLEHFKTTGVILSRMCMQGLMEHGAKALEENKNKIPGSDLEQAAITIIVTTGWVSMLVSRDHSMDYNGGVAHALFYSLCDIPGFDRTHLHGVTVGFGCLLLLLIDGQQEEFERLRAFNRTVGLPATLAEADITLEQIERVCDRIIADEDVEHYPYRLTREMIMNAAAKLA